MIENLEEIKIENMIYEIRGKQVMLDSDIAALFRYETKQLNRQVQRNQNRFPENYCFQLTTIEYENLRCQNGTSSLKNNYGGRRYLPYVFTEYGITMLAGLLKSDVAVEMSLKIVNTFIMMRKYISNNLLEQRFINNLVLEHDSDLKLIHQSLEKLETKELKNEIYFQGQIYDAYSKIIDILSIVKDEIILIDGYANKSVLDIVSKVEKRVILIVKSKSSLKEIDIKKYQEQYNNLTIIYDDSFHDRYFILDRKEVYHCGTSLNYAGSKTFSINKIEDEKIICCLINEVLQRLDIK